METVNNTPNVTIVGTTDADSIRNLASNVTINTDGGNDIISIYGGVNYVIVEAGDDSDYIYNAVSGGATLNGGNGDDFIFIYGTGSSDSRVNAGSGNDSVYNESSRTTIGGGEGADTIRNYGTLVTIDGGKDNDTMILRRYNTSESADEGLEIISYTTGDGDDTIYNYNSNDTLKITGSSISTTNSSDNRDVIVKIDSGSITLKDYAGAITAVDNEGQSILFDEGDSDADADSDADSDADDTTSTVEDDTTSTVEDDTTSTVEDDTTSTVDDDTTSTVDDDTTSTVADDDTTSTASDDTTSSTGADDTTASAKKYDIVFLIDNTGSMNEYIDNAKANTASFVKSLKNEGSIDYRLGLVVFGDETDTVGMDFETIKYPFTDDVNVFIENVNAMPTSNGGDGPESGLEAIEAALSYDNYRDDAQKYFIVITDNNFHNQGDTFYSENDSSGYLNTSDVQNDLNNANVKMDVVGTKDYSQSEWEPMATLTSDDNGNGKFYDIDTGFPTIMADISNRVVGQKSITVNLGNAASTNAGVFVINSSSDSLTAIASLKSVAETGDTIVGTVTANHVYEADPNSVRQLITIPDRWNVAATKNNDNLIITGSNATVKGADGNDYISIDSNVSTVTLADLNVSEDDLTLLKHITPGDLDHSVENNQLTFSSNDLSFTLSDQSALTSDIKNYNVHNAGDENTIADLLYGTNTHRVSLSFTQYGINPTKTYISNLADKEDSSGGFFELTDGEGSRSLWGGIDGDDVLVGSDGYDEFFYCKGNGNDTIEGAADNDLINLLNVSLDDIDLESFANAIGTDSTTIKFYDGGSIKVNGTSQVGFKVANVDCIFCVKDRQWSVK